jgi:hypothetical protein
MQIQVLITLLQKLFIFNLFRNLNYFFLKDFKLIKLFHQFLVLSNSSIINK